MADAVPRCPVDRPTIPWRQNRNGSGASSRVDRDHSSQHEYRGRPGRAPCLGPGVARGHVLGNLGLPTRRRRPRPRDRARRRRLRPRRRRRLTAGFDARAARRRTLRRLVGQPPSHRSTCRPTAPVSPCQVKAGQPSLGVSGRRRNPGPDPVVDRHPGRPLLRRPRPDQIPCSAAPSACATSATPSRPRAAGAGRSAGGWARSRPETRRNGPRIRSIGRSFSRHTGTER